MFMEHIKYNVLVMRDDSHVKSFRVSNYWFQLVVYGNVLLFVLAVLGATLTYKYWRLYTAHDGNLLVMRTVVDRQGVELERLRNLNRIMQSEITTLNSTASGHKQTLSAVSETAVQAVPAASPPVEVKTAPDRAPVTLRIENFQAGRVSGRINLKFDIKNSASVRKTGYMRVFLAQADGAFAPADLSQDAATFAIRNLKQVRLTLPGAAGQARIQLLDESGQTIISRDFRIR